MSTSWSEILDLLEREAARAATQRGAPQAAARRRRRAPRRAGAEAGFTVPEMLIAAFMVAAAAGLIATAIYQIFFVSREGNARLAVLGDLENAALWLGRDVSEATAFTPGSGSVYGSFTTSDPTIQYRYSYDASNTAMVREVLVSGSPDSTLRVSRRIADQGDVTFSNSGKLMTISLTATSGPTSESTTLKLAMRVD